MWNLNLGTLVLATTLGLGAVACANQKPAVEPVRAEAQVRDTSKQGAGTAVVIAPDVKTQCGIASTAEAPKFGYDSAVLEPGGRGTLDVLAHCLLDGPLRGKHMQLVGRADPRGEDEYNMALGSGRAEAVAAYLRAQGVSPEQLGVTSRGELDAQGHDEAGWTLDRRVDVALKPAS